MIDFKSTVKMAIVSLKINKMRSMLTSLGIIIGVSAVIIMLAVGTGASEKVKKIWNLWEAIFLQSVQPRQNQAALEWEWEHVRL